MNIKKHFETATEKFEFTIPNKYSRKKVLEFTPKDPEANYSDGQVSELSIFGKSMNVHSITKSGLMLYSYDLLDNKITAKIKWEDVEIGNTLDIPNDIPGFEGTKEALDNLSIFK
jgi:hypothetical protein